MVGPAVAAVLAACAAQSPVAPGLHLVPSSIPPWTMLGQRSLFGPAHRATNGHDRRAAACPAYTGCLDDSTCSECLSAVRDYVGVTGAVTEDATTQREFFWALNRTAACHTANPDLLGGTMLELMLTEPCTAVANYSVFFCQLVEYRCFADPSCRGCLAEIATASAGHGDDVIARAFNSSACLGAPRPLIEELASLFALCYFFPACTYYKQRCAADPQCVECWGLLREGRGAEAAARCAPTNTSLTSTEIPTADALARSCLGNTALMAEYFQYRCDHDPGCAACWDAGGGMDTIAEASIGAASQACNVLREHKEYRATQTLWVLLSSREAVYLTVCTTRAIFCVFMSESCIPCFNATAVPDPLATQPCKGYFDDFGIVSVCHGCSEVVYEINRIVMATSVVGSISLVACFVVTLVIVASKRDKDSVRDRVILGLMFANAVYSSANAIPLNSLRTGVVDCGQFAMSFETIRFGRAWWFLGKYSLVAFEALVLGSSIWVIRHGVRSIPPRVEAGLHGLCVLVGLVAFTAFYVRCEAINKAGYNEATQIAGQRNNRIFLEADDDANDWNPSRHSEREFNAAVNQFDELLQTMLVAWAVFLGVAMALWLYLRWTLHVLLRQWEEVRAAAVLRWSRDYWDPQDEWRQKTQEKLLNLRREGYEEIARPLEPFVFVFVLFGIPACVMASEWCVHESSANSANTASASIGYQSESYGTCDVWCELVLAFRSLGTAAVFFSQPRNRQELLQFRTLCRRLWARLRFSRGAPTVRFREEGLEEILMIPDEDDTPTESSPHGRSSAPETEL